MNLMPFLRHAALNVSRSPLISVLLTQSDARNRGDRCCGGNEEVTICMQAGLSSLWGNELPCHCHGELVDSRHGMENSLAVFLTGPEFTTPLPAHKFTTARSTRMSGAGVFTR